MNLNISTEILSEINFALWLDDVTKFWLITRFRKSLFCVFCIQPLSFDSHCAVKPVSTVQSCFCWAARIHTILPCWGGVGYKLKSVAWVESSSKFRMKDRESPRSTGGSLSTSEAMDLNGVDDLKILGAQNPNFWKMPNRENKLPRVTSFTLHTNKPPIDNNSSVGNVILINTSKTLGHPVK